jgi:glucose-6-phosphate dehydrogenase assembly protein OpcA
VFCRWRGQPPFGASQFEQLVDIVDRLVVDTAEWDETGCEALVELFERTAVSDIAWARTLPWRAELAGYWPSIREQEIYVRGPRAEGTLLRAWLAARLGRAIRPVEPADELGVRLGGEVLPAPRWAKTTPSDLLSAELDKYGRDRMYEEAVAAAAASA